MKSFIIFLCSIFVLSLLNAQNKYDFDYKIDSDAFGQERKFYVHVHEDYYLNETDSFGVIYVLDAQASSFYNNAKSIIDYLVWGYQISPVIVVGIHNENRGKEFIPLDRSKDKDDPKNNGEAQKLRDHLENEVFPMIKKNYKVNDFKALIGHSRAGAFIANTIFSDQKDLFNAYISISPGMHYLNNQILDDAEEMIKSNATFNNFYFCTYGTVGSLEAYFKPQVNFLDSLFTSHPNNSIEWGKQEMTGKTHWGVVAPSIAEGMLAMNRAYQVDQLLIEKFALQENKSIGEQIDTYYQAQKEKLKITFPINASRLRNYGDEFAEAEQYDRAIELYNLSLEINKNDVRPYYGKAWAYRQLKDHSKAEKVYNEALAMLTLNEAGLSAEELEKKKSSVQKQLDNMKKAVE